MYIAGIQVANPVNVTTDTAPVVARNVALGGLVNYDHTLVNKRMFVHNIAVSWQGVTSDELHDIRLAWRLACLFYTPFALNGLNVIGEGDFVDSLMAIALEDVPLQVTFDQAYVAGDTSGLLYNVTGTWVTEPQTDNG